MFRIHRLKYTHTQATLTTPLPDSDIPNSCGFKIPDSKAEQYKLELILCKNCGIASRHHRVQERFQGRGGRPGLSVLMSPTVYVDVKQC